MESVERNGGNHDDLILQQQRDIEKEVRMQCISCTLFDIDKNYF